MTVVSGVRHRLSLKLSLIDDGAHALAPTSFLSAHGDKSQQSLSRNGGRRDDVGGRNIIF